MCIYATSYTKTKCNNSFVDKPYKYVLVTGRMSSRKYNKLNLEAAVPFARICDLCLAEACCVLAASFTNTLVTYIYGYIYTYINIYIYHIDGG